MATVNDDDDEFALPIGCWIAGPSEIEGHLMLEPPSEEYLNSLKEWLDEFLDDDE